MKKSKSLLAALLAAAMVTGTAVSAAAEPAALTTAQRLENAAVYMKETYAPSFASGELNANMWSLLCALGADKLEDPDYAFLIPQVDAGALDADASLSDYACSIIALGIQGQDPSQMDGRNLVQELADMQEEDGGFAGPSGDATANELPFVIMALELMEAEYDQQGALDSLVALRKADGGYSWDSTAEVGNVDTSGLVLFGLSSLDDAQEEIQPTVDYLLGTLQDDQYFVGEDAYAAPNACSQATAILGLASAGADADAYAGAREALYALQTEEGGFLYDASSDAPDYFSTYQGILALAAVSLQDQDPPADDTADTDLSDGETETDTTLSSDTTGESDTSAADQGSQDKSADTGNHKTGDEGINPLIIVVLVIAVAAVAACVVVPMVKKKKKQQPESEEQDDDQNRLDS